MYYVLAIVICLLLILYVDSKYNKFNFISDLKKVNFNQMVRCLLLFIIVIGSIYFLFIYFNFVEISRSEINLLAMIISVFLTPLLEEYIFRYLPYKLLRLDKIVIMLINSVLFTILHGRNLYESIIIFLSSISLNIIYLKTDKISNCIVCHSVWNLVINILTII